MKQVTAQYWFPKVCVQACPKCLYFRQLEGRKPGRFHSIQKHAWPFHTRHGRLWWTICHHRRRLPVHVSNSRCVYQVHDAHSNSFNTRSRVRRCYNIVNNTNFWNTCNDNNWPLNSTYFLTTWSINLLSLFWPQLLSCQPIKIHSLHLPLLPPASRNKYPSLS